MGNPVFDYFFRLVTFEMIEVQSRRGKCIESASLNVYTVCSISREAACCLMFTDLTLLSLLLGMKHNLAHFRQGTRWNIVYLPNSWSVQRQLETILYFSVSSF